MTTPQTDAERLGLSAAEVTYAGHLGMSLERYAKLRDAVAGRRTSTVDDVLRVRGELDDADAARREAAHELAVDAAKADLKRGAA